MQNDWCITAVVVGDRYRRMLDAFMRSYRRFEDMPQVLLCSEKPQAISHTDVQTTDIGNEPIVVNGDFNMCLKRLAFQHAVDRGYEKIIFIDIDRTIEEWCQDTINRVAEPGFGTNWLRSVKHDRGDTQPRNIKHCKYRAILKGFDVESYYDLKYPIFGESLNIVNQPKHVTQQFIDTWGECAKFIKRSDCSPRHINVEMGVSLKLNNIPVYKYKLPIEVDFKGSIFKHYAYGKKSQLFKQ